MSRSPITLTLAHSRWERGLLHALTLTLSRRERGPAHGVRRMRSAARRDGSVVSHCGNLRRAVAGAVLGVLLDCGCRIGRFCGFRCCGRRSAHAVSRGAGPVDCGQMDDPGPLQAGLPSPVGRVLLPLVAGHANHRLHPDRLSGEHAASVAVLPADGREDRLASVLRHRCGRGLRLAQHRRRHEHRPRCQPVGLYDRRRDAADRTNHDRQGVFRGRPFDALAEHRNGRRSPAGRIEHAARGEPRAAWARLVGFAGTARGRPRGRSCDP